MTPGDAKNTAKDISDRAVDSAGRTAAVTQDDVARGVENVHHYAARASEAASGMYEKAQERVRSAAEQLPDSAAEALATGRRALDRGSETVGRQVSSQPLEALLLA